MAWLNSAMTRTRLIEFLNAAEIKIVLQPWANNWFKTTTMSWLESQPHQRKVWLVRLRTKTNVMVLSQTQRCKLMKDLKTRWQYHRSIWPQSNGTTAEIDQKSWLQRENNRGSLLNQWRQFKTQVEEFTKLAEKAGCQGGSLSQSSSTNENCFNGFCHDW